MPKTTNVECYYCGFEGRIKPQEDWEDEDLRYCPACGQPFNEELDFSEE